jgi:hypothetical protein
MAEDLYASWKYYAKDILLRDIHEKKQRSRRKFSGNAVVAFEFCCGAKERA